MSKRKKYIIKLTKCKQFMDKNNKRPSLIVKIKMYNL